jgi:glycerate 2-kinase
MKIILAIDSFKGCLTSIEAECTVAESLFLMNNQVRVIKIPVSDGGEGMLDAFCKATGSRQLSISVHDPLMRKISSCYGLSSDGQTAIIEMAQASGLTLLREDEFNPMNATSYGTGELILDALSKGARKFIIGLGGSATCDAGTGMLQALGVKFFNCEGRKLEYGGHILQQIDSIDMSDAHPLLSRCEFIIASDVRNPLYGPNGAACVFAPQKGADAEMVKVLDDGLRNFSFVVKSCLGKSLNVPSAGAAGGVGAALVGFMKTYVCSGIDLLLEMVDFNKELSDTDLVITGEGCADCQTLMGKLPYGILLSARKKNVPVVLLAGKVGDRQMLFDVGFCEILQITPPDMPLSLAIQKQNALKNISSAIANDSFILSMVKKRK